MYSKTCLIHFAALYAVLNSVVNVIDDLYTLIDDIARKAEEDSLRQSSLRELFRCKLEIIKTEYLKFAPWFMLFKTT